MKCLKSRKQHLTAAGLRAGQPGSKGLILCRTRHSYLRQSVQTGSWPHPVGCSFL